MASLIPGYEYDIFISYRQKDNKGDKWVSEFVEALKTELESTFKEEVSVYFDINPHDGLLETHDVNESLKDKLKCLVFIPIISRTYCDPNSFAWGYEFKAFVEQASKDKYGLKIKLPNGNVESRVLPISIYDLDPDDINLCESVLGGVLRGIDFIYAEPGVNRPLKPDDDEKINLNKTRYRNQVNKVGNSIKDVITAIQHYSPQKTEVPQELAKPVSSPQKSNKTPIIITSVVALALIILGILFIPKLFKSYAKLEKSIAVMPFRTDNTDIENVAFINDAKEKILNNLQSVKAFRVISSTSTEKYRNQTSKSIPEIAKELGVNYIVEGYGNRFGDKFSLNVQLIDASKKENHIWGKSYESDIKAVNDVLGVIIEVAEAISTELETELTSEEKQLIEKTPTENLDAYYAYQRGRDEYSNYLLYNNKDALNRAENFYNRALENDPSYAQAYTGLAQVYWEKHYDEEYFSKNFMDSVLLLTNTALSYDKNIAEAYSLRGDYFRITGNFNQAIIEYEKALKINPNYWQAYSGSAVLYLNQKRDFLQAIKNQYAALRLNHDPKLRSSTIYNIAYYLDHMGFFTKAEYYYKEFLKLSNDSSKYYRAIAWSKNRQEKYPEAIEFMKEYYKLDSDDQAIREIGDFYLHLGIKDSAIAYYKKYILKLDTVQTKGVNDRHRVGFRYLMIGNKKQADLYFDMQKKYCEESIELNREYGQIFLAYYDLAGIYAIRNDKVNAFKNLNIYNDKIGGSEFATMVWFLKTDPFFDNIRNEPEFQAIYHEIEEKYNNTHEKVRKWLEENDML